LHYQHVLFKEVKSGRHIAPAVITRLPVDANRTDQLGDKRMRIVKTHVQVAGHDLVVIASHWRSRMEQGNDSGGGQRNRYADVIYGDAKAMILSNPKVDVLICGDFNDDPTDVSVTDHLKGTGDMEKVRNSGREPYLLNLMAGKDPKSFGTHYYSKWHIFDQIIVSPGMLDGNGWSCKTQTVQTIRRLTAANGKEINLASATAIGQPWRFGDRKSYGGNNASRGYSDHFPVTVMLNVKGEK
jgi:hypothetical protein